MTRAMRKLLHRLSVWFRRLRYCHKCGERGMHGDMLCPYMTKVFEEKLREFFENNP